MRLGTNDSTEHMYPCQRFDEVTVPFAPVQASNTLPLTVSRPCRAISKASNLPRWKTLESLPRTRYGVEPEVVEVRDMNGSRTVVELPKYG